MPEKHIVAKAKGEKSRLLVLITIARKPLMTILEISAATGLTPPAVRHHCVKLTSHKKIRATKVGKSVLFSLTNHASIS